MTTILVIEDDTTIRENIVDILNFEGYQVLDAEDGEQGLALAQQQPDLIVCDISMPKLDGYELLSALREKTDTTNIPLIFLTARADRSFVRQGMELGADDYITKPFTNEELLSAITARLRRNNEIRQAEQEELDEIKNELIRTISHELRTPLISIASVQEFIELEMEYMSPDELQNLLNIQRSGSQRLHHLIEQMILMTQITTEKLTRDYVLEAGTILTAWDLITSAINLARKYAYRNKDILINTQLENQQANIFCLPHPLHHAVAEIIINSINFSPQDDHIELHQWESENKTQITVQDNGPGMPTHELESILKPFTQVNRQVNEQQGAGLGLTLASKVIQIHDGKLEIESVVDQGTKVVITLPTAESFTQ